MINQTRQDKEKKFGQKFLGQKMGKTRTNVNPRQPMLKMDSIVFDALW
jgi:hypothetical protein